jgi:hypothetical protein
LEDAVLEVPGFSFAGEFSDGQFKLLPGWAGRAGVYIWAKDGEPRDVIRVGIACGGGGIVGRHVLHNRWLRGDFKPNDAREQAVRKFTLEGLGTHAELWAAVLPDRTRAIALEDLVRAFYGARLKVDLSVRDSWIKEQMNNWRKAGRPFLTI